MMSIINISAKQVEPMGKTALTVQNLALQALDRQASRSPLRWS